MWKIPTKVFYVGNSIDYIIYNINPMVIGRYKKIIKIINDIDIVF